MASSLLWTDGCLMRSLWARFESSVSTHLVQTSNAWMHPLHAHLEVPWTSCMLPIGYWSGCIEVQLQQVGCSLEGTHIAAIAQEFACQGGQVWGGVFREAC